MVGIMRSSALIFLAITLTGCHTLRDVTDYEPYSDYVGRTLTLKRHAFLFRNNLGIQLSDGSLEVKMAANSVGRAKFERMSISEREAVLARRRVVTKQPPHIAELPPGTTLWLRKVTRSKDFEGGGYVVEATGTISSPNNVHPIPFRYLWGYDRLDRAPWEDDTVSSERSAEYVGKQTKTKQ